MAGWKNVLVAIADNVETHFDMLRGRLDTVLRDGDPLLILPYYGYGSPERLFLRGRVLQDEGIRAAQDNDRLWDNLLNMYRRLESDEVPGARVRATFRGLSQEVVADEEGFFEVALVPKRPLPTNLLWHQVELELLAPLRDEQASVRATGHVAVPPPQARFGVISDIDDTVLQSHVPDLLRMARLVFLGNARTRLPFPGVAAFYGALQAGSQEQILNPLFYVSSSPWNLYDLLVEFFRLQAIPIAPLFLRDWGITRQELLPAEHHGHKLEAICGLLDFYQDLPFILVGDSGQQDPEIYREVVDRYSGRILAVYVRDVSEADERDEAVRRLGEEVAAAGSTLILAEDTMAMAQHAARHGWIAPETVSAIAAAVEEDEAEPEPLEALLEEAAS